MGRRNDLALSPHFKLYEFEDRDSGEVIIYPELIACLERLRELVQRPVVVLSGYRTPARNAAVGGAPDSYHLRGMAADVTWAGYEIEAAVQAAVQAGFDGIGRYPRRGCVHVDVRGYLARWEK